MPHPMAKFKRKNNPLATKSKGFDHFKVKSLDDEAGTFSAYGNVTDIVDHAGDVSVKGCFVNTIKKHKADGTMPKFLGQHEGRMMPLGIITDMIEDEKGLRFEGKFCLETQAGREAHALVKMGAINQFSIGYRVVSEQMKGSINYISEYDVKEISLVTFACNEESVVVDVKSLSQELSIDTLVKHFKLSEGQAKAAMNAIEATKHVEEADAKSKADENTIENFRIKMADAVTNKKFDDAEMQTKNIGNLSFSDVCHAIRKKLIKIIGHPDFWLCDIYAGYGYVEFWDYVEETFSVAMFTWTVTDDMVEVSDFQIGDMSYSQNFKPKAEAEDDDDDDDDEGKKSEPEDGEPEDGEPEEDEKALDPMEQLAKADWSFLPAK